MADDNIITVAETSEQLAAEEAAFATSFNEARGEAQEPAVVAEEVVDEVAVEPAADPKPEVTIEETPAAAPAPRLIGGLTEEQVAAALARAGTLQSTVDKMAGRMGQLMQQIEQLRNTPPTTQAQQKALDLKLEKLSGAFPELANLLREDLQGLQGGDTTTLAPVVPAGITQEQFDQLLTERLSAKDVETRELLEIKVLNITHPDWEQVIRTPEFALFRDNVLPQDVGRQLMVSEDSAFISQKLSEFKQWRATATATPAPVVEAVPAAPSAKSKRLANAVLPAGTAASSLNAPVTEEDGFAAGFANERKRAGYNG